MTLPLAGTQVPLGGPTPTAATLTLLTLASLVIADLLAGWRATGRLELIWFGQTRRNWQTDRGSLILIQLTMIAGLWLGLLAPRALPGLELPGSVWVVVPVGLVIAWAGIGIRVWAILTLGGSFRRVVTVREDQPVVSGGPYRYVRHPSYTGMLLALTGIGIALDNWASLAAVLGLPLIGFIRRIQVEEQALEAGMGERYRAYARGRPRLVPGVW